MNDLKKQKRLAFLLFFLAISILPSAHAAFVVNGNFQTGDFTGWSLDVDGFPLLPGDSDITLVEPTPGDFAARLQAEFPTDTAFFAATLHQGLDLTATFGEDLLLSFSWDFNGDAAVTDEFFVVALGDGSGNLFGADGNLGFLLNPIDYGSGTFSSILDTSFINAANWTLDFQIGPGFDFAGSFALIDNVSLVAVPAIIPVPPSLLLFVSGLAGLGACRRRNI